MNDGYITAMNSMRVAQEWVDSISENLSNVYTPGYREKQTNFRTFLEGSMLDKGLINTYQGKSTPGTSPENVFLEGKGFFVIKDKENQIAYTRLGEFKFDGEGIYKSSDGKEVQGYMLDDSGQIMGSSAPQDKGDNTQSASNGGEGDAATTSIKLWMDPNNGKYLGKYDEFEIKTDGVIYGKSSDGKVRVPLYKIAIMNFNNPQELAQIKPCQYIETDESGKPVVGKGDIRSGLIELANTDFKANLAYMKMAKIQMDTSNALIKTNKTLLQQVVELLS
jgi:flagellar hook protein FlgE